MLNKLLIHLTNIISTVLLLLGFSSIPRKLNDPRVVFYHGIGNGASTPMKYLNDEIPISTFKAHIEYLCANYRIISLDSVVSTLEETSNINKSTKPVCVISFDDGLHSVYEFAYPELKKNNLPFAVFINTSVVNNINMLWLHKLGYLIEKLGIGNFIHQIKSRLPDSTAGLSDSTDAGELENWGRKNIELLHNERLLDEIAASENINISDISRELQLYLNWDEINEMAENGAEFYSHTHEHYPLKNIQDDAIINEQIKSSANILDAHEKCGLKFMSFPFGMETDYGKSNIQKAFESGHEYIVEVGNGLNHQSRIFNQHIISRVGLGTIKNNNHHLYSAIEIRPIVKSKLKALLGK